MFGPRRIIATVFEKRSHRRRNNTDNEIRNAWFAVRSTLSAGSSGVGASELGRSMDLIQDSLEEYYAEVRVCFRKCMLPFEDEDLMELADYRACRERESGIRWDALSECDKAERLLLRYRWPDAPDPRRPYGPGSEPEQLLVATLRTWGFVHAGDRDAARSALATAVEPLEVIQGHLLRQHEIMGWRPAPDVIGERADMGPAVGPGRRSYQAGLDARQAASAAAYGVGFGLLMGQLRVAESMTSDLLERVSECVS